MWPIVCLDNKKKGSKVLAALESSLRASHLTAKLAMGLIKEAKPLQTHQNVLAWNSPNIRPKHGGLIAMRPTLICHWVNNL